MSRTRQVLLVVLVLVFLSVVTLLATGNATRSGYLDPDNPEDVGGQALARVLADEGIEIVVARGQERLLATDLDGALVVVTDPASLGRSTFARLESAVGGAEADLLLVGLNPRLGPLGGAMASVRGQVSGQCDAFADLTLATQATAPVVADGAAPPGSTTCFASFDGPLLVAEDGRTRFSADSVLRNDQILRADNAAVALRLLGSSDRLVWYVPSTSDTRPTDGVALTTLLPPWTTGMLVLGVLAFGAFVVQRGRRLGPLVTEPVPVAVRSAESTLARGRLYAAARDRTHAASALRAGTRTRLAARTGLGPHAGLDALLGRLGDQGQDEARARALLTESPVTDDRALVELATDLTRLEDEVART